MAGCHSGYRPSRFIEKLQRQNSRYSSSIISCCCLHLNNTSFLSNWDVPWRSLGAPYLSCSHSVPKSTYDTIGIPGKITVIPYPRYFSYFKTQAAFDPRVLSSVCFFATDIHSASLGKGKNDDTLVKVRNGDLTGKGELVVCTYPEAKERRIDP